jgi:8-oxo-dGTP pyrophosphatase MutT (NUDIX family)
VETEHYLAALAHFIQDGRVLLPQSRRRGVWKTVGGRTEPGETPEQTMLREVGEEIGVRPMTYRRLPDRTVDAYGYPARIAVFAVTAWEGEPRNVASGEHSDLRWFSANEVELLSLQDVVRQEALRLLSEMPHV